MYPCSSQYAFQSIIRLLLCLEPNRDLPIVVVDFVDVDVVVVIDVFGVAVVIVVVVLVWVPRITEWDGGCGYYTQR
jgi:hypothetical protein